MVGGLAGLNDLTGYAGGNFMFVVGPPKPDKLQERGQTKTDELILQEWGFWGWAGNLPKENKVFISKDAPPWISADQMIVDALGNAGNASMPEKVN